MKVLLKICFLMALSLGAYSVTAQTLHAIVVMDDVDRSIGAAADGPKMQSRFEDIAQQAGMTLNLSFLKKSELERNQEPLSAAIEGFSCNPLDAVFFYYTGHGVDKSEGFSTNRYPVFRIGRTAYAMEEVDEALKAKNPRLRIIMYDACNWRGSTPPPPLAARNPLMKKVNYQKLFKNASGYVRVASNTYGQNGWSYGESVNGGVFTRNFLASLDEAVMSDDQFCTWEAILNAAKNTTQTLTARDERGNARSPQIPDFEQVVQYKATGPSERLHGTPDTYKGALKSFRKKS